MRKWILLALVGLVLLYLVRFREGVDDTLTKEPICPSGMTQQGEVCQKDHGAPTLCPSGRPAQYGFCMESDGNGGTSGQGALCAEGTNVAGKCVSTRPPNCPSGYVFETDGPFGTYKCITSAAFAKNRTDRAAETALAAEPVAPRGSSSSTYTPIPVALSGPLPSAIDERASSGDTDVARPLNGDVFGANGPFSGRLGTGQGTGTAAAVMNGNTYGPPGQTVTLAPFDLWKGSKGTGTRAPTMPGTKMPVDGPTWGGVGSSTMSRSAASSQPAPALYGPVGSGAQGADSGSLSGWGYSQKNSVDTSMLPSGESTGSEPSNAYAVTSRVPGDMDMFPFPYIQSSSYSLANGSMKTDPVPFLTDFSAFQN